MEKQEEEYRLKQKRIQVKLIDPNIYQDPNYPKIAKEGKEIDEVVELFDQRSSILDQIKQAEKLKESDDLAEIAKQELVSLNTRLEDVESQLDKILNPINQDDKNNVIVEIRAGVGGDEAGLFAADLFRMYEKYCEKKNYKTDVLTSSLSASGSLKEIVFTVDGELVFGHLKYESGVHRVQRVPQTESQGRLHTSTATVAILQQVEEQELEINEADVRVDTFRSSSAGGQSVNTTDSAIRLTHTPTGIVVSCQDERSQLKNKQKAFKILRARIKNQVDEEQSSGVAADRKQQVGQGLRSQKIRTYNFPQDRITDHRLGKNFSNLKAILGGQLETIIDDLRKSK